MMNDADKGLKREIRLEAGMRLGRTTPSRAEAENILREVLESRLSRERLQWPPQTKATVIRALADDILGFGPLEALLRDNSITEIMINGPSRVYIEKTGKKTLSQTQFDDEAHLRSVTEKMLARAGRRLDESSPYVDFSLVDGSRVNVIIPPVAPDGSSITIRKFLSTLGSREDLVRLGTINGQMSLFLEAAIKAKLNILFAGATGAGKTATMDILSKDISMDDRIITIEDALELKLSQAHVVRLLTRGVNIEGKGAVSARMLFSNALRMRPSRLILGEIRGDEALDFLQALNSGHDGTLAVIHASTPADAVGRLETLTMYAGLALTSAEIRRQIASGLNLILQHEMLVDGSRKVTYITEVAGMQDGNVVLNDIFRYQIEGQTSAGATIGDFRLINQPRNLERFRKRGIRLDSILRVGQPGSGM